METEQQILEEQHKYITELEAISSFYNKTTNDYHFWDNDYNMHFGYFTQGCNPFRRNEMLAEMNQQLMERLHIRNDSSQLLLDLGCGIGATMQYICKKQSELQAIGYTISPTQIEKAKARTSVENKARIQFDNIDISSQQDTGIRANYCVAVESLCHTPYPNKSAAIAFMNRHLRSKGRFVIADAFRIGGAKHKYSRLAKFIHKKLCKNWILPCLAEKELFIKELQKNFHNIRVENISWKVAPSILHVPFAITAYLIKNILNRKGLSTQSLQNLKGSFYTFLSALCMNEMGYLLISGEKK